MPALIESACAKSILFGEHAVVYGHPAIAIPIRDLKTRVTITPNIFGEKNEVRIISPSIGMNSNLDALDSGSALRFCIEKTCEVARVDHMPACIINISSNFPTSGGLGSSASCAIAVIRAVSKFLGHVFPIELLNELAFQSEKITHSNPSGVDNTVIAYEKPVYYIKDAPIELISLQYPLHLIFAFSGIKGLTREAVEKVRDGYTKNMDLFNQYFQEIQKTVIQARERINDGDTKGLGSLMTENHRLLQVIGVSIPMLDKLVEDAKNAGAVGAKLCGSGLGGNIVALVEKNKIENVKNKLKQSGAIWVHHTEVKQDS